jgi:hypothetical protein
MTREEIRRRALGAAAAVSLTLGLTACATEVVVAGSPSGDGQGGQSGDTAVETAAGGQGGMGGVGGATASGGQGGAVAVVEDAGSPPACISLEGDAYLACCDEHLWDWDAGCMAWGPPMPPAMPGVMA